MTTDRPVTIAMLTYQRPEDLAEAIPPLVDQAQGARFPTTVLVIDNDPDGSAMPMAANYDAAIVRFVHEPRPGIAAARNRALAEATDSAALVFIDDDERPHPDWLDLLTGLWAESNAAAVVGPVVSTYPSDPEPWISEGGFFDRRRLPTGTIIDVAATNNLLLDLDTVRRLELSFNEEFGATGGSDTLFTRQLHRGGGLMLWCDEAIVTDVVPPVAPDPELAAPTSAPDRQLVEPGSRRARDAAPPTHAAPLHPGQSRAGSTAGWAAPADRRHAHGIGPPSGQRRPHAGPRPGHDRRGLRLHLRRVPPIDVMNDQVAPHLGVIVVNYAASALLERHLKELPAAAGVSVIVVDNFSSDEERSRTRNLADQHGWLLETPAENLGFGAGVNLGWARAERAGCTHLLFLNPDVEIALDAIDGLLAASAAHPQAIITPRLDRTDGSLWFAGGQLNTANGTTSSRPDTSEHAPDRWLTAACLLVPADAMAALDGFDEDYFLYWEDVDLTRRWLERGGELRICHDLVAVHAVGGTQAGEGKSPLYCRYMCRNRLLFARRHHGWSGLFRWGLTAPMYAARVLRRHGFRSALRRPATIVAALRGTLEGFAVALRPSSGQPA